METKILQIFYGADNLPYKDKERQVHYPVSGQSFSGASLTTEIRFYTKEIGGVDSITWVANAKRPDGKIAYQQLESNYDSEVEESYVTLQLSQWFTEKKGDLFITLNGYSGGVDIQVDEDSGLYTVSGTPIIQATGSIKVIIAYAPIMNNGYGAVPEITVQEALGAVANKLDKQNNPSTVYGVNADSEQVMLPYSLQATPSTLARRDLAGQINVPLTPTDNANATSKSYVDTFGKSFELTMDSDYKLYATLKDANGNVLGTTQVVDLPLESVVVGGSYDSVNKALVLILDSGNTISIPIGDLIDGLVSEEQLESALEEKQDTLVSGTNIKTINGTTLLGSGNYAFDVDFDENSTNALENRVISKEVKEINYELAIIREGLFEVVLTELDYSVDFATLYAIPDTLSDDDGTHRVVYSETQLKRIDGNTVVNNQLVVNGNFVNTSNWHFNRMSITVSDNIATLKPTANSYTNVSFYASGPLKTNHIYLGVATMKVVSGNVSSMSAGVAVGATGNLIGYTTITNPQLNVWYKVYGMKQITSGIDGGAIINPTFNYGSTSDIDLTNDSYQCSNVMLFDLTQMFPFNTPTTLDDVRVQWLLSRGYIAYNNGSLLTGTYSGIRLLNADSEVISTISIPTTELKSAGTVHDYIEVVDGNVVEGEQLYNLVKHTLVGSVDLGSLNWTYQGDWDTTKKRFYAYFPSGSNVKTPSSGNNIPNAISSIYIATTNNLFYSQNYNKTFAIVKSGGEAYIHLRNDDYISSADFKNAMSGVYLYYELSTPTEETIATDLRFNEISSLIEQGGSIETLYTNVPPNSTTTFVVKKAVGE